jgi:hypothetical protein
MVLDPRKIDGVRNTLAAAAAMALLRRHAQKF